MKRKTTTALVALLLCITATSCSKQKTCRCAVPGSQKVHIINIEHGECSQLLNYNTHNLVEQRQNDVLVCTDYEFLIDSVYSK